MKPTREQIQDAINETEYKYFGDYEMSESQRQAVSVLVDVAQSALEAQPVDIVIHSFDENKLVAKALDMFGMIDTEQMYRTIKAMRELNMSPHDVMPQTINIDYLKIECVEYVRQWWGEANDLSRTHKASVETTIDHLAATGRLAGVVEPIPKEECERILNISARKNEDGSWSHSRSGTMSNEDIHEFINKTYPIEPDHAVREALEALRYTALGFDGFSNSVDAVDDLYEKICQALMRQDHIDAGKLLFNPLQEMDMLELHFQGLLEGYANKMEWFAIAARTDTVIAAMKSLRASLMRPAVPEWQPIETAPRDGSCILITGGEINNELGGSFIYDGCVKVSYNKDHGWCSETGKPIGGWILSHACYYGVWVENPTHWMPLPAPPKQLTESPENITCADLTNAADSSQNIEHTGE